jgi:linoleoyl-CoA desaturase
MGSIEDARERVSVVGRTFDDPGVAVEEERSPAPIRPRIRFPGAGAEPLASELKGRVSAHFRDRGLSDKANASMVVRTVVMFAVTFGAYALILTAGFPWFVMLGLAVVVGVGVAGLGFGVSHDAVHGAYSSRPKVNRIVGYTFDLCGASSYMWALGHNIVHHTYTNIPGVDGDVASSGLLRQAPGRAPRWFHRYQQLYAFPLYSLATLNWVLVKDYKDIFQRDFGPYRNHVHPRSDLAVMLAFKAVYYGWTFFIPLFLLPIPWWQVLIGYVAMNLTAGLILGIVFPLAHVVEGPSYPVPDAAGVMSDAWIAHELATTANFANGQRLLTWYIGSLNHQIEHHLFPRVCSVHYPAISKIVRDVVQRHALPYHHNATFFAAVRSHYRALRKLGRPEAAAAEEPTASPSPALTA